MRAKVFRKIIYIIRPFFTIKEACIKKSEHDSLPLFRHVIA